MRDDVTLRDLASSTYVGVSESDSLLGTARLMAEEAVESAVVLRGADPVGTVTAAGILDVVADDPDLSSITAGETMGDPPPALPADERPSTAAAVLANGARQILVTDGDELVGTVDPRDLLAVGPNFGPEPTDAVEPGGPPDAERVGGTLSASTAEAEHRQGICETCGTLTRDLAAVNGQLMCPDCREV